MPPKTASKPAAEAPNKRTAEPEVVESGFPHHSASPSDDEPESSGPIADTKSAKPSRSTTNKRKAATKSTPASSTTDVKRSIETPAGESKPKRPRIPASARPRPTQLHVIGATVFARPFTTSDRTLKNTKVLATVEGYEWDDLTRGWAVNVTFAGPPMPVGASAWLPEKLLDGGFKVGELVSVKVNGGWCDGEVSGRTVEGDDGWGYEVEVVGRVRVAQKDIKAMTEVGKAKAEKVKGEVKEEQ